MKRDKLMTILAGILLLTAVLEGITGKLIYALFMLIAGIVVIRMRGTGKFNDRSNYEKSVKANNLTIDDVYEAIKDIETPLGKAWLAGHTGYKGDSIVLGPGSFRDMIVISYDERHKLFSLKHINKIANITRDESDEWRFTGFVDTKTLEVNPENFSYFASWKLYCAAALIRLTEMIEKMAAGEEYSVPKMLSAYSFSYYNDKEGYFVNENSEAYMKAEQNYDPFEAVILDLEDNPLLEIIPNDFDKKGRVLDSEGYLLMEGSELVAEISRTSEGKNDCFTFTTDAGEFKAKNFPAVDRANFAYNYIITRNGEDVAVTGGNGQIRFEKVGMCENDVVICFDNEYQEICNILWIFIMTLNKVFKEKK